MDYDIFLARFEGEKVGLSGTNNTASQKYDLGVFALNRREANIIQWELPRLVSYILGLEQSNYYSRSETLFLNAGHAFVIQPRDLDVPSTLDKNYPNVPGILRISTNPGLQICT